MSELAAAYDMSFAAVQKHVAVLEGAELVTKEPRGRERIVRGNPEALPARPWTARPYEQIWRVSASTRLDALLTDDATERTLPCPSPPSPKTPTP